MVILVKIIALIILILGIVAFLNPKAVKNMLSYWKQGKRIYAAAVIRLLFGGILLLSASDCRLIGIVITLGIFFLVAGIIIFILGLEKSKAIVGWVQNRPILVLRLMVLIPIILGILLLYSA